MSLTYIAAASALLDIVGVLFYSLNLALGCCPNPILCSTPKHCNFAEMPCLQEEQLSNKENP